MYKVHRDAHDKNRFIVTISGLVVSVTFKIIFKKWSPQPRTTLV